MAKQNKDFFTNNEVIIVGYPLIADPSMKMILQALLKNGINVYALNDKDEGTADIKVYKSLSELPKVPKCAYMWADKKDIDPWIGKLAGAGVTKVLFHSKKDVDPGQIEASKKAGLETEVACPMMFLGKGIHAFHRMLAGVK